MAHGTPGGLDQVLTVRRCTRGRRNLGLGDMRLLGSRKQSGADKYQPEQIHVARGRVMLHRGLGAQVGDQVLDVIVAEVMEGIARHDQQRASIPIEPFADRAHDLAVRPVLEWTVLRQISWNQQTWAKAAACTTQEIRRSTIERESIRTAMATRAAVDPPPGYGELIWTGADSDGRCRFAVGRIQAIHTE